MRGGVIAGGEGRGGRWVGSRLGCVVGRGGGGSEGVWEKRRRRRREGKWGR